MKRFLFLVPLMCSAQQNGFNTSLPFTDEYYTLDIWTQTAPEYFGGLPQAYGVPNNYVSAPGSYIILTMPSLPPAVPPVVDDIYVPPLVVPVVPVGTEIPESNNAIMVFPVLIGLIAWRKLEVMSGQR